MAGHPCNYASIIPLPNAQVLTECLASGQVNIAAVLSQVNQCVCETLKTIEKFSDEQEKLYSKGKSKLDKMDKIINELSEKCQAMQQALLFKEEKYDEKCREVERYKMICEMAAEEAIRPSKNMTQNDSNNNDPSNTSDDEPQDCKDGIIKLENRFAVSPTPSKRHIVKHAKFSLSQAHLDRHVVPFQPVSPPVAGYRHQNQFNLDDERNLMAQYYAGGPTKRKTSEHRSSSVSLDFGTRVKDRLEMIGGVNIRGSQVNAGPVSVSRLMNGQSNIPYNEEADKRIKIDVTGQRNEFMSSSGNNAQRMKQRIVEKGLHKQVAGGTWTRFASRRKKDWPF